jgi:hypothetical protein
MIGRDWSDRVLENYGANRNSSKEQVRHRCN